MLQPLPEMSDMGNGSRRGISMRRRDDSVAEDKEDLQRSPVWRFFRLVLPAVILLIVFFVYLMLGAVVFRYLENTDNETTQFQNDVFKLKTEIFDILTNSSGIDPTGMTTGVSPSNATSRELIPGAGEEPTDGWSSEHQTVSSHDGHRFMRKEVDHKIDEMVENMNRREWKAGRMEAVQAGRAWSFPSAMLFCMTTITTIGYGDIVPLTAWGRAFCVLYSIVGIPLSLICLANIGNLMARLVLKLCRLGHRMMVVRHRLNACSCRYSAKKRSKVVEKTSSKKQMVSSDVEIGLDTFESPPDYSPQEEVVKQSVPATRGFDALRPDQPCTRSVSIATERPTFHPKGVTKQENTEVADHQKSCACECECQCPNQAEPDILEEVPLFIVVIILVVYMCAVAALMSSSEDWSFGEGLYFSFITLTTIGFGDLVPTNHYARDSFIPCIFLTLFGLSIMSMCIALVQEKIIRTFRAIKSKIGA